MRILKVKKNVVTVVSYSSLISAELYCKTKDTLNISTLFLHISTSLSVVFSTGLMWCYARNILK